MRMPTENEAVWFGRAILVLGIPAWFVGMFDTTWMIFFMFIVAIGFVCTWIYPMYLDSKGQVDNEV